MGVMITGAIEAHEGQDIATFDIPGAYLHALSDEQTIMLLKGPLAELMVMVDPKNIPKICHVQQQGGLWTPKECASILQEAGRRSGGIWI